MFYLVGLGLFDVKLLFSEDREISLRIASLFDSLNCRLKEYLEDKYGLIGSICKRFDGVGDMRSVIIYNGLKECDLDRLYVISKLSR